MKHALEDGPVRGVVYVTPAGSRCRFSKMGERGALYFAYIDGDKAGFTITEDFFDKYLKREAEAVRVPE